MCCFGDKYHILHCTLYSVSLEYLLLFDGNILLLPKPRIDKFVLKGQIMNRFVALCSFSQVLNSAGRI